MATHAASATNAAAAAADPDAAAAAANASAAAAAAVAALGDAVTPPPGDGTFAAAALLSSLSTAGWEGGLTVVGVGALRLPLSRCTLRRLDAEAAPAPFGRGAATLTDVAVRDCAQIDAAAVGQGEAWTDAVHRIATALAVRALGADPARRLTVSLHKLLLYGPGGHFDRHVDAEKAPGMWGTLALQLPVVGGHGGGGGPAWGGGGVFGRGVKTGGAAGGGGGKRGRGVGGVHTGGGRARRCRCLPRHTTRRETPARAAASTPRRG